MEEGFARLMVGLLRQRLRAGDSLILASRKTALIQELCEQTIVLDHGKVVEHRTTKGAVRAYAEAAKSGAGNAEGQGLAPSRHLSQGRRLRVPEVVGPFNSSAALLFAELHNARGRTKRIDAAEEVTVRIGFETALPDVEVQLGIGFTPRGSDDPGIRVELPEPFRFGRAGSHTIVARILPGSLQEGVFVLRADAIVANPAERGAGVIARVGGPLRISGEPFDVDEPTDTPVAQWDGRPMWPAVAEWTIEDE